MIDSDRLGDHLDYFLRTYLPIHKGASPHTRLSYRDTFLQLMRYCRRRFPDDPNPAVERLSPGLLLDFLAALEKERGNSAATRNTRLAAVKSFFRMLALLQPRYHALCRQIGAIPFKRAPQRPPDALSRQEVDLLFSCVKAQSRKGFRDLCILRTLYNTGVRASELCSLRLSDVGFAQRQLRVLGKGGRLRSVPLWDSTLALLRTYLKSERWPPCAGCQDALFINQRRSRLTRSGLYHLCRQYLQTACRKRPALRRKKIHPVHGWRYTTASHLLLAGVDVTVIQEWLGHASIDTTCSYKRIPVEVKRQALEKFYLFEQPCPSSPKGVDWSLYPDLLAFLESL